MRFDGKSFIYKVIFLAGALIIFGSSKSFSQQTLYADPKYTITTPTRIYSPKPAYNQTIPSIDDVLEPTIAYEKTIDPDEYILGPGDRMELRIWGKIVEKYALEVAPDGNIYIPELGVFAAAGRSLTNFRTEVAGKIAATYINIEHTLVIKGLRHIKIQVGGQVKSPGWYTFKGMVRVSEVIQKAGGILPNGSYKHIVLTRENNSEVITVNLRSILNHESGAVDPYIRLGDVITSPLQSDLAEAVGQFFKPGLFEIGPGDCVSDLIEEAGGVTLLADMKKTYVERGQEKIPFDVHKIVYNLDKTQNIELKPGDKVFIGAVNETVYVLGAVARPGAVMFDRSLSIMDYVALASGPTGFAKLAAANIVRGVPDNIQRIPVNLKVLMKGKNDAKSPQILPGDVIIIPSQEKLSFQNYINYAFSIMSLKKIFE